MPVLPSSFERFSKAALGWSEVPAADGEQGGLQSRLVARLLCVLLFSLPAIPVALLMLPLGETIAAGLMIVAAVAALLLGFVLKTGNNTAGGIAALTGAGTALAVLSASTGGLSSPFLYWATLLPIEAMDVKRTCAVAITSVLTMAATILAATALSSVIPVAGPYDSGNIYLSLFALAGIGLYAALRTFGTARKRSPSTAMADTVEEPFAEPHEPWPGLVVVHDAKGRIVSTCGVDETKLAKAAGLSEGSRFIDHIHVADRINFLQAVDRLRTGEATSGVTVRLRNADEPSRLMRVAIDLVARCDNTGNLTGFASSLKLDEPRTIPDDEDDSRIRFLASVGHELKTPLNAMLGYSALLESRLRDGEQDSRQAEYAGLIGQSGEHLLAVLDDMLDTARIREGRYIVECTHVDMRDVVAECEAMLRERADEKGIILTARVAKGHKGLLTSKRAARQIVLNLLSNALKFTPRGGAVTIDVDDDCETTGIRVSDTGIGIAGENLVSIGNPFFQVQCEDLRQDEGIGLGLYLVKGLVAAHGGTFAIESRAGEGTTVNVNLPNAGPLTTNEKERRVTWPDLGPGLERKEAGLNQLMVENEEKPGEMRHGHARTA